MENSSPVILAIDQGSGSTKTLAIDLKGEVLDQFEEKIATTFPKSGWVEQDPEEIWQSTINTANKITKKYKIAAVGLSVQRESILIWDRKTGNALTPVITWQDRRATELAELHSSNELRIKEISGLQLDPMFSALKLQWLLENYKFVGTDVCIGTIDSWIAFNLGAGHIIEVGSASRTQLLDIESGNWSEELLNIFKIQRSSLPKVCASDEKHLCTNMQVLGLDNQVPLSGIMGDSHAALFAHQGWKLGNFKATLGTGTSLMGATEHDAQTIAWSVAGKITRAVEANILSTGSSLLWLAELFEMAPDDLAKLAEESTQDLQFVPAFNGLGAPWWDRQAQAIITGLTRGSSRADLAAAALRSTAAQINDVLEDLSKSSTVINSLNADGGGVRNPYLMQMISDLTGKEIRSSKLAELSAFGAALVAALGAKVLSISDLEGINLEYDQYRPKLTEKVRQEKLLIWRRALAAARVRNLLGSIH